MNTRRSIVRALDSRPAFRLVQAMAGLALLLSFALWFRQADMTECQARYNERSNASQRARAEAAESDRQALDELLEAVASQPRGAIRAIREYNAARAVSDRQRAANPVPAPPSETCG